MPRPRHVVPSLVFHPAEHDVAPLLLRRGFGSPLPLCRPERRPHPLCYLSGVLAGVPVSSRVSAKIQQLVNTLKQPRRPPLREFFVDDFDELLEGQEPFLPLHDSQSCRSDCSV